MLLGIMEAHCSDEQLGCDTVGKRIGTLGMLLGSGRPAAGEHLGSDTTVNRIRGFEREHAKIGIIWRRTAAGEHLGYD